MGRRRSRYVVPGPRAGSVLLGGGRSGARRSRGIARRPVGGGSRPHRGVWLLGVLVVVAAVAAGVLAWRSVASGDGGRRAAAERFLTGWTRRDWVVMWQALTPPARAAYPRGAVRGGVSQRGPRGGRSLGAGREARQRSGWRDRGAGIGGDRRVRDAARHDRPACVGEPGTASAWRGTRRCGCPVCAAASGCIRAPVRGRGGGRSSLRTGRRLPRRRLAPRSPGGSRPGRPGWSASMRAG